MKKNKIFKCPLCLEFKSLNKESIYKHIEKYHSEYLNKNMTAARLYFNRINNKTEGRCIVCHRPTKWNEKVYRYDRICSKKCAQIYKEQFRKNMLKKYGKTHLLNDPDMQKKMLAGRKISGIYKWKDGTEMQYTGSYEKDFIKFCEELMNFKSYELIAPAPQIFKYKFENKDHFYIPDFYFPNLNLIVEIKDGGSNPNMHHKIQDVDKKKELIKDKILEEQNEYNYIKITDKDYSIFLEYLIDLKAGKIEWIPPKENDNKNMNLSEAINALQEEYQYKDFCKEITNIFNESIDEFNNLYPLNEQELLLESSNDKVPLFVMVSTPGIPSPFSSAIRKFTNCEYSHSSISLDPKLEKFYSFTLEKGFIEEPKKKFIDMKYKFTIMYTMISKTTAKHIQKYIDFVKKNQNKFSYNKKGLISLIIQRKEDLQKEFVCSQFVSKILSLAHIKLVKDYSLYTPKNFLTEPNLKFLIKDTDITDSNIYNKIDRLYK